MDETAKDVLSLLVDPPGPGERALGVYLYPYRLFGPFDFNDPVSTARIVAHSKIGDYAILITCNGGMFVPPPAELPNVMEPGWIPSGSDIPAIRAFMERAATICNAIICDLALRGIVSEATTPTLMSMGKVKDGYAAISGASGGRESYTERTIEPLLRLLRGGSEWVGYPMHDLVDVESALALSYVTPLMQVSHTLPGLVAGAYSMFSRHHLTEAVIDSWIVIEQIIDWYWTDYVRTLADPSRKKRLEDTRTYSAAVRIEMLDIVGILPPILSIMLHNARKIRNELAHRASIDLPKAQVSVDAMQSIIELLCGRSVAPLVVNQGINW